MTNPAEKINDPKTPLRIQQDFRVPDWDPAKSPESQVRLVARFPWRAAIDVYASNANEIMSGLHGSTWKLFALCGTARITVAKAMLIGRDRDFAIPPPPTPTNGTDYVLGARNIICDSFELMVEPASYQPVPFRPTKTSTFTVVGRGDVITGAPTGIPSVKDYSEMFGYPWKLHGGEGEFGSGATILATTKVLSNLFNTTAAMPIPITMSEITGWWKGADRAYLFIYDRDTTQPIPANGTFLYPPERSNNYCLKLEPGETFSWCPRGGRHYHLGIQGLISSTPNTLTYVPGSDLFAEVRGYY